MKLQFKVSVQNGMAAAQFVIDDNPDAFEALQDEAAAIDAQIQGDVEWHSVEDSPTGAIAHA